MTKRISLKSRHLRWNWEQSRDDPLLVRYHVVVVDNKRRDGRMSSITGQIQAFRSLEPIRREEGRVDGSPHHYLFESFDANVKPSEVDFTSTSLPAVRDRELYERQRTDGIANYVANLFADRTAS